MKVRRKKYYYTVYSFQAEYNDELDIHICPKDLLIAHCRCMGINLDNIKSIDKVEPLHIHQHNILFDTNDEMIRVCTCSTAHGNLLSLLQRFDIILGGELK